MFAIVDAYRYGLLHPRNWLRNIIAGIIVGVVALPLAMAFAIASGVKPEQGLYTAIIAGAVVAIFGGSRVQIAGPTGAFVVILANITAHYGVVGLQMASLMAGIILIVFGLFKLGNIIKFIPDPVIVGFTAGIGVIIFVGGWKDFFGLPVALPIDAHFYQRVVALCRALPQMQWATTGLAVLSVLLVILTPKIIKRIPGPLVTLVVVTALNSVFQFRGVATIGSTFGAIAPSLAGFHFPATSMTMCVDLIGPAFTIALLGAIESLLSATAADGMTGTRHHANQELMGQGYANILAPLFGGFAATGAIARTATNVRNGGNCALAAIVHSVLLLLVIVLLASVASSVPLCVLAAILFVVAYNMSDIPHMMHMIRHAPRYDVAVMMTTLLLTVLTNLVLAVNIGIVLAMLFFVGRMHQTSYVTVTTTQDSEVLLPPNTLVYHIEGPLFFGVAEKVERALSATGALPTTLVFCLGAVPFMDITGLEMFSEVIQRFHRQGVQVYVCEANARVARKLAHMGMVHWLASAEMTATLVAMAPSIRQVEKSSVR